MGNCSRWGEAVARLAFKLPDTETIRRLVQAANRTRVIWNHQRWMGTFANGFERIVEIDLNSAERAMFLYRERAGPLRHLQPDGPKFGVEWEV